MGIRLVTTTFLYPLNNLNLKEFLESSLMVLCLALSLFVCKRIIYLYLKASIANS